MAAPYDIRLYGDPVLRRVAAEIAEIDGTIARIAHDMIETMHDAPGIGLAAPQVGISSRLFVYDIGDGTGPKAIVNPVIHDARDVWVYEEGCLSIPGMHVEITRPKEIEMVGRDLDGNEISIEADELLARVLQHELDHLDGVLMIDRLEPDRRRDAIVTLTEMFGDPDAEPAKKRRGRRGLTLP